MKFFDFKIGSFLVLALVVSLAAVDAAAIEINEKSLQQYSQVQQALKSIEHKFPKLQQDLNEQSIFENQGDETTKKIMASPAAGEVTQIVKENGFSSVSEFIAFSSRLASAYFAGHGDLVQLGAILSAQKQSFAEQKKQFIEKGMPLDAIKNMETNIAQLELMLGAAKKAHSSDIEATKKYSETLKELFDPEEAEQEDDNQ